MATLDQLQEVVRTRIELNKIDNGWDVELSKWLAMIDEYKRFRGITPDQNDVDSATRFLLIDLPNLGIIQDIRQRMMLTLWRGRRNLTGKLVHYTGGGAAIPCALMGLFIATVLMIIGAGIWFATISNTADAPAVFMSKGEVAPLVFSAMLGAIAGQFLRVAELGALRVYHPLLVAMNGLLKPLAMLILAIGVFAIFKIGIVKFGSIDFTKTDDITKYAIWVVGLLSGFSERFAPDVVRRAEGAIEPRAKQEKDVQTPR
jgi:hypothetical protein